MKNTKLVVGILSIVLSIYIFYQSQIARILSIFEDADTSGETGYIVGGLILVAGIIGIVARSHKGAGITAGIFYILAAFTGFWVIGVYKDLAIWSGVSAIFGIIFIIGSFNQGQENDDSNENNYEPSYGDTIIVDDFEVTIEPVELSSLDNADVLHFPVKIMNTKYKSRELNSSYYKIYTPSGTEAKRLGNSFDDDISNAGSINPEITIHAYLRILYEGDGHYYAEFAESEGQEVAVKLPVKK